MILFPSSVFAFEIIGRTIINSQKYKSKSKLKANWKNVFFFSLFSTFIKLYRNIIVYKEQKAAIIGFITINHESSIIIKYLAIFFDLFCGKITPQTPHTPSPFFPNLSAKGRRTKTMIQRGKVGDKRHYQGNDGKSV